MSEKMDLAERLLFTGKIALQGYVDPEGAARELAAAAGIDIDPLFEKKRPARRTSDGDVIIDAEIIDEDDQ